MEHTKQSYASLYHRLLAGLCDLSIYIFIVCLGFYLVLQQTSIQDTVYAFLLFSGLILINPLLIYHSVVCLPLFGGSIGKLVSGLHVVTAQQHFLSFKHAFFRQTVGYQFSAILLGLGFLAVTKDPHRQGWHDKAIGSYVVIFHPYWFLGLLVSLAALFLSGLLLFQGITVFWNGPVPKEYMTKYAESRSNTGEEIRDEATPDDTFEEIPSDTFQLSPEAI